MGGWALAATASVAATSVEHPYVIGEAHRLVANSRLCGMTNDDTGQSDPASAKEITALLRESRSLSRRADKFNGAARAVEDPTTQQLAAQACTTMDQLVHHLMTLERHALQGEKSAARRR